MDIFRGAMEMFRKRTAIALKILDHQDAGLADFFSASECALRLNLF